MSAVFRLGIPHVGGALLAAARDLQAPLLVSANALGVYRPWTDAELADPKTWRIWETMWPEACGDRRRLLRAAGCAREFLRFRSARALDGLDVALDSAGFVAQRHYGGFPWEVWQYVALAGSRAWAWWSQMDVCCEAEVAPDRTAVRLRQAETIRLLHECRAVARDCGISMPMAVLQGRTVEEYQWHADRIGHLLDGAGLVGVGSMCRRPLGGREGLAAVLDGLEDVLPAGVRVHLFGVKSDGLAALSGHPRVASVDSMAWDVAARRDADRSMAARVATMRRWYLAQVQASSGVVGRQDRLFPVVQRPTGIDAATAEWADLLACGECSYNEAAGGSA